jgi:hypothetical protein
MSAAGSSVPLSAIQLVAFKCPTAQICVLRPLKAKGMTQIVITRQITHSFYVESGCNDKRLE